jgi:transketolase
MTGNSTKKELALQDKANKIRRQVIEMIAQAGTGHPGGSLGQADILTALYFDVLNHRPRQPDWAERDRFILSSGHTCPAWYATLAEAGYFDVSDLKTLRQFGSRLQGHPHPHLLPGVEHVSGLLGQGISLGCGLAEASKLDKNSSQIFVLTSDGEHQEGQTWEAYRYGGARNLTNLTIIVDRNNIQIDGKTQEIAPIEPLAEKITSFNWQVLEIDGHDFGELTWALNGARTCHKPTAVICQTTAGKGVSFMENSPNWHGRAPSKAEAKKALQELDKTKPIHEK